MSPVPPHQADGGRPAQALIAAESTGGTQLPGPGPGGDPAAGRQPCRRLPPRRNSTREVNVEELGTRIEGINLSLRNLEAELNEKRDFTADQLDSLLSRLDILVLRQKDLTLFRDLIAPQEQAKVGQIDSSRSVVATMGTRIAELRTRLRENEALPEAERDCRAEAS